MTTEKLSADELTHARQVVTAIAPWVETSELGELRRAAYILLRHIDALEELSPAELDEMRKLIADPLAGVNACRGAGIRLLRHIDALEAERAPVAFANDAKERGKQMASHIAMIEKRGGPAPDWIDICAEVSTRISAVAYMACEKTSLARIAKGRADYDAAVRNVEDLRRRFAELTGPPCDRGTLGQELRALLCRNSPTPWSELASELQEEYRTAAAHLRARGAASRQEEVDALRSAIASRDDTIARLDALLSKPGFDFLSATDEARAAGAASRDGEVAGLREELTHTREAFVDTHRRLEVAETLRDAARIEAERLTAELATQRTSANAVIDGLEARVRAFQQATGEPDFETATPEMVAVIIARLTADLRQALDDLHEARSTSLLLRGEVKRARADGAREEREACAEIAERCSGGDATVSKRDLIAARIRARGQAK